MNQYTIIQNEIDDLIINWPQFQTYYRSSTKYPGVNEQIKSKECKAYIKKIEKLRKIQDALRK